MKRTKSQKKKSKTALDELRWICKNQAKLVPMFGLRYYNIKLLTAFFVAKDTEAPKEALIDALSK